MVCSQLNISTTNEILGDFDACAIPGSGVIQNITGTNISLPINPLTNQTLNPNQINAQDIRNIVCEPGRLTQILNFVDNNAADNVHASLCNLTLAQFFELVEIFRQDVDPTLVEQEVRYFKTLTPTEDFRSVQNNADFVILLC